MSNISSQSSIKFEIAVEKAQFFKIFENSKKDNQRPNAEKLVGDWINIFASQISDYEKIKAKIQSNLAPVYLGNRRADAAFFRGNAHCKYPKCPVTYCLSVPEKPINENMAFVLVNVTREKEHLHDEKTAKKNKFEEENETR